MDCSNNIFTEVEVNHFTNEEIEYKDHGYKYYNLIWKNYLFDSKSENLSVEFKKIVYINDDRSPGSLELQRWCEAIAQNTLTCKVDIPARTSKTIKKIAGIFTEYLLHYFFLETKNSLLQDAARNERLYRLFEETGDIDECFIRQSDHKEDCTAIFFYKYDYRITGFEECRVERLVVRVDVAACGEPIFFEILVNPFKRLTMKKGGLSSQLFFVSLFLSRNELNARNQTLAEFDQLPFERAGAVFYNSNYSIIKRGDRKELQKKCFNWPLVPLLLKGLTCLHGSCPEYAQYSSMIALSNYCVFPALFIELLACEATTNRTLEDVHERIAQASISSEKIYKNFISYADKVVQYILQNPKMIVQILGEEFCVEQMQYNSPSIEKKTSFPLDFFERKV